MTGSDSSKSTVRTLDLTDCRAKTVVSQIFFNGSNFLWCTQGAFRLEFSDRAPLVLREGEFTVTFPNRFITFIGLEDANSLHGGTLVGPNNEEHVLRIGFWDCFTCTSTYSADNMERLQQLVARQVAGDAQAEIAAWHHADFMLQSVMATLSCGREALFYDAVRLINANFLAGNVSIKSLYKSMNCSPTSVIGMFKAHGLPSPIAYLHRLQAWRACHLLRRSRLTIEEVSRVCGFSGNSALTRFLRDWMKISPSEIRNGVPYALPDC